MMNSLIEELKIFTEMDSNTIYDKYHKHVYSPKNEPNNPNYAIETAMLLNTFLTSTIDEVRLRHAEEYSKRILSIIDCADADHFRRGVLQREISKDISYQKQRDHAAHTLYNYLLGWYILNHSEILRKAMFNEIRKRTGEGKKDYSDDICWQKFGNLWPFSSLLHDIGYLLEGAIEVTDIKIKEDKITKGLAVIKDYFDSRYWVANNIGSIPERDILRNLTNVHEPDLDKDSLPAIIDTLRSLGDLKNLRKTILKEYKKRKIRIPKNFKNQSALLGDSFSIWENYHCMYDSSGNMTKRIRNAEKTIYSQIWNGMSKPGIKLLDHGMCSGLISLLYSTYYFRMYFAVTKPPSNTIEKMIWNKFIQDSVPSNVSYRAKWWWTSIVWATSAAAIHNLQQQSRPWCEGGEDCGKLTIEEDPLSYLGILVDIIEEWDRYNVKRMTSITGTLPIQGIDVLLGNSSDRIHIVYPDSDLKNSVKKSLDIALEQWDSIIEIN